jgi:hypothetical protein
MVSRQVQGKRVLLVSVRVRVQVQFRGAPRGAFKVVLRAVFKVVLRKVPRVRQKVAYVAAWKAVSRTVANHQTEALLKKVSLRKVLLQKGAIQRETAIQKAEWLQRLKISSERKETLSNRGARRIVYPLLPWLIPLWSLLVVLLVLVVLFLMMALPE